MESYDAEEEQGKKKAPPVSGLAVLIIPVVVALVEHSPERRWSKRCQNASGAGPDI